MKKYNFIFSMVIMILLTSCAKKYDEIIDGEQDVQVLIAEREFLVPKKYIDNPSLPVQSPLIFDKKGSMIAYFYWPTLDGLAESDNQQRFGRFNHQVVSMQWYIKNEHYIDAQRSIENIQSYESYQKKSKLSCPLSNMKCIGISSPLSYEWMGNYEGMGSFYIRCPKEEEKSELLLNQVCNLAVDYDDKNIYIESLISSNFIASEDDLPKILNQMKAFIDDWEVNNSKN
ncbi:hypothetical protein B9T31_08710 [Acinetobacter sp. ANC 4558]|uniref:hypothetical protein n=1 Tax=Acinetobacter sp. ANC 4558 TaxID=1977876 RepID=UPI000A35BC7E|nr:hypothetical protein [Acinetobacter sp. ANC 4558]OTG86111.1 hypothetical protein B9T31_08710 [Acinetobacter sp. ANC 4558]